NGTLLQTATCDQTSLSQQFILQPNGDITTADGSYCVDNIYDGIPTAGDVAALWTCEPGYASQKWVAQPNGTILNPASGLCLDTPPPAGSSSELTYQPCTGSASQLFDVPVEQTVTSGHIVSASGPASCLTAGGSVPWTGAPAGTLNLTVGACDPLSNV